MSAYHVFHAAAYGIVIRSIRGPFEPMSERRPARARSPRQQLAVARLVEPTVEVDRAVAGAASG